MPKLTRCRALALVGAAAPALRLGIGQATVSASTPAWPNHGGPFQATQESLARHQTPAWFNDATFGIWSHWDPQSGVEQGDWYARKMYIEGEADYKHHLANYGPKSKVGYKDLIRTFKAVEWDPDHLLDLYSKAGAKYFIFMGVHYDNFDMWNSKYQSRWNSVATSPKRDIVGEYARAARERGWQQSQFEVHSVRRL